MLVYHFAGVGSRARYNNKTQSSQSHQCLLSDGMMVGSTTMVISVLLSVAIEAR